MLAYLVLNIVRITSDVRWVGHRGAIYFSGNGGYFFLNKIIEGNSAGIYDRTTAMSQPDGPFPWVRCITQLTNTTINTHVWE
jgi:hypothetical protein